MDTTSYSKTRLNWIWGLYRVFISESLLFAIFLFPVRFTSGKGTVTWSCLAIMLISTLLALVLSRGKKEKVNVFFYTVSIPVIIIFSFLVGIHWSMIIIMILFIQWRLYKLLKEDYEDDYLDNKNGLLLMTIVLGLTMYVLGKVNHFAQIDSIMFLILLQMMIFPFGVFVNKFAQAQHKHPSRIVLIALTIIIVPAVIAGIVSVISGILRTGFSYIISAILYVLWIVFKPILQIVFDSGLEYLKPKLNENREVVETWLGQNNSPPEKNDLPPPTLENLGPLYAVLIIAFVCLAIWAFYKFRKFNALNVESTESVGMIKQRSIKKGDKRKSNYWFNPDYSKATHQVRKCVDELERFAIKRNISRDSFESARGWMKRIHLRPTDEWLLIYEKVRYGNMELSNQELAVFLNEFTQIKKKMKTILPTKR